MRGKRFEKNFLSRGITKKIMGSIFIHDGMKIERTAEELAELEALQKMKDEDIDFSDIPEITLEEWKNFYPVYPATKKIKRFTNRKD